MKMHFLLLYTILAISGRLVCAAKEPGILESFLRSIDQRPWLLSVYVLTVGLPVILFISLMWPDKRFGPPDHPYYYKKSDEDQPDDPEPSLQREAADIKESQLGEEPLLKRNVSKRNTH